MLSSRSIMQHVCPRRHKTLSPLINHSSRDPTIRSWDRSDEANQDIFGNMGKHIHIGSDHAGMDLKHSVKDHLKAQGYEVMDKGTHVRDSVDYPDYAHAVASAVTSSPGDLGIVICGSGNGVNITANKHQGIRSALAWNPEIGALARQHNNANILALPARYITAEEALRIVDAFLASEFEGGRHQRRIDLIEPADQLP